MVESFGVKFFSTFVYFFLAALLGPTPFGLLALTKAFILLGDLFIEQGFVEALIQRHDLQKKHLDAAFWSNWIIGGLLYGVLFLIAPYIASFYEEPVLTDLLRVGGITFLIGPTGLAHQAILTRNFQFKQIAISRVSGIVVGGIAGLIAAFMGLGVWSLIIQQILFVSVSVLGFWYSSSYLPALSFSKTHFQDVFSFGFKMLLNKFTVYLSKSATELIIGFFLGTELLGIYSFANKIYLSSIETVNSAVSKIMLPLFSSVQKEPGKLKNYFYQAIENVYYVLIPILIGILFFSENIIGIFKEQWLPAIPVLQLLATAGTIYMIFYYSNNALVSLGRPGLILQFNIWNALMKLSFTVIAAQFGIAVVASTHILVSVLLLPLAWYYLKKALDVKLDAVAVSLKKPIFIGMLVAGSFFLSDLWFEENEFLQIFIQLVFGGITFLIAVYYSRPKWSESVFRKLGIEPK